MPTWFEEYLLTLSKEQKADLGCWILTEPDDNKLTTQIIEVLERK